jgi:hypothetical protein
LLVANGSVGFDCDLSIAEEAGASADAVLVGLGSVPELFHPCGDDDGEAAAVFVWNVGCGLNAAGLAFAVVVPSD